MPRYNIYITERSGNDLADYQVLIRLEDIGFTDWANLTPESIYFLDDAGNPLYFWIEELDVAAQRSRIWVKVPLIPALSTVKITMVYGETNPYPEYHNPERVFVLFDHFDTLDTTKWVVVKGSPTIVDSTLRLIGNTNDTVRTASPMPANVKVILRAMFASFGSYGPRLGVQVRRKDETFYEYVNEQGNLNTAVGYYNIIRSIDNVYTVIGKGSRTAHYSTNEWFREWMTIYNDRLEWRVKDGAEVVTATDTDIVGEGYIGLVTWDSGNDVRIDYIAVANHVDPDVEVSGAPSPPVVEYPASDSLVVETEIITPPVVEYSVADSLVFETEVTAPPPVVEYPASDSLVVETEVAPPPPVVEYPVADSLVFETEIPPSPPPTEQLYNMIVLTVQLALLMLVLSLIVSILVSVEEEK
jgi:Uncharacterized conserved protein